MENSGRGKLLNEIHKHVFCAGLILCNQFGLNYCLGAVCKSHLSGMFIRLFDLYGMK